MWDYIVKFFEYLPLYIVLILVPAIIRTIIDAAVIKINSSAFDLPPSKPSDTMLIVRFEDIFSSLVGTALYAPLVEEIVFRACPYFFLGLTGLVVGNIVWILAHPSWQLRYVSGLPLKKKIAFTLNAIFYYTCAAIFFSIPWMQGFGLLAVVYHMAHNGILTAGGIFHEIEFPAPWKKEEAEYFRESRGLRKKLEEKFFKDTNPPKEEADEADLDVDLEGKFFKELGLKPNQKPYQPQKVKPSVATTDRAARPKASKVQSRTAKPNKPTTPAPSRAVVRVSKDDWLFWW